MSRRQNTTYLYVREGARPRADSVPSHRPHLPAPVEPARPVAEQPPVRLVRPHMSAADFDPRFALFLMPESEAADAYRVVAERLRTARPGGGRVLVTALGRATPRTRTTLNLAAALAEETALAAVVDLDPGSGALAAAVGVSAFPGLRAQSEVRERDPRRTVDLLHVAARVGALPLEADGRLPAAGVLTATLGLLGEVAPWVLLDAAPLDTADRALWPALADGVVVVVAPHELPTAAQTIRGHLAGLPLLGVVVAVD